MTIQMLTNANKESNKHKDLRMLADADNKCSHTQARQNKLQNSNTHRYSIPLNAHKCKQRKQQTHRRYLYLLMLADADNKCSHTQARQNKHTQSIYTCECWQMPITKAHKRKQIKATHTQPTKATTITYQNLPSQSCQE